MAPSMPILAAPTVAASVSTASPRAATGAKSVAVRSAGALLALVAVAALSDAPRLAWQGVQLALLPHPTCMTEVYILDGVQAVAHGRPLYPPLEGLPWIYHIYNPLTYLPAGLAGRMLGLNLDGLLVAGRIVPLVSGALLVLLWGWYAARAMGERKAAPFLVALICYYHTATLTDFFRLRPETPGLLLTMAAWMIAQVRPRHWPIWAAALCVAAIGHKQTFLAAPCAVALQLVIERNVRDLCRFAAAGVTLSLALLGGSWLWLGAGFWEHTVFAMQADPIRPLAASRFFYPILLTEHWGLLTAALACGLVWLAQRRRHLPLLLYLAVCFLWTSTAHGKVGADVNYHGELSLLMTAVTALAALDMLQAGAALALAPAVLLAASVLGPLAQWGPGWNQVSTNRAHPQPFGFSLAPPFGDAMPWVDRYRPHAGRALIFDNEIALRVGQPVVQDWLTLTLLLDAGRLEIEALAAPIRQRSYDAIVFDQHGWDRWTRQLRDTAVAAGYRVTLENERLLELRPEERAKEE